jgi:hypothetical protein
VSRPSTPARDVDGGNTDQVAGNSWTVGILAGDAQHKVDSFHGSPGKSALCNDFTTSSTTLNVADAAVGFHQLLYHSSAEFVERFAGPDRGGAYPNTSWLDQPTWDNIGFEENVSAGAYVKTSPSVRRRCGLFAKVSVFTGCIASYYGIHGISRQPR